MTAAPPTVAVGTGWSAGNQRLMAAEVEHLRVRLAERAGVLADSDPTLADMEAEVDAAQRALAGPSALDQVVEGFGLSPFEREVLVAAAAAELDARIGGLAALVRGDPRLAAPTFGLAFELAAHPHWDAVAPDRPLRAARLVEVEGGPVLDAAVRLDERVLHHLLGVDTLDDRLRPYLVALVPPVVPLPPSLAAVADRLAAWWEAPAAPPLQVFGPAAGDRQAVAALAAEAHGATAWALALADLPPAPPERDALLRLWRREAVLAARVLVVEVPDDVRPEVVGHLEALLRRPPGRLAVSAADRLALDGLAAALAVDRPTRAEQAELWATLVPEGQAHELAEQLDLGHAEILAVPTAGVDLGAEAHAATRARIRGRLDGLAERLDPRAGWDDLVLPPSPRDLLGQLAAAVRQRTALEAVGFGRMTSRGLGVTALFTGPSGTGKTLAAEVVAADLGLDLYRIDLAALVSKWIGETEKNLRRVFDAAEQGGAVLLFDEADALFGKRSETRDSHDRYANIEVAYLLQRMERYRGLAVLTTNLRTNLDPAFLRRLRFVVHFPHPDASLRARLWRAAFPPAVATEGLDVDHLARLDLTGGNIRNIALQAVVLAAADDGTVRRRHVRRAAAVEYAKLDRPLADIEAWS